MAAAKRVAQLALAPPNLQALDPCSTTREGPTPSVGVVSFLSARRCGAWCTGSPPCAPPRRQSPVGSPVTPFSPTGWVGVSLGSSRAPLSNLSQPLAAAGGRRPSLPLETRWRSAPRSKVTGRRVRPGSGRHSGEESFPTATASFASLCGARRALACTHLRLGGGAVL